MKRNHSIFIGWQSVILALAGFLYGLLEPAYALQSFAEWQPRTDATVLLLQQTDTHAGTVTPDVGVHHFDLNAEVTLTAVPKPGYYFVYWIGDVSDPTANSTIVYLDAPKIVVAVFERSEYEFTLEQENMPGGGGGGNLYPSVPDYSRQGGGGGGGRRLRRPELQPQPENPPLPAPEEVPDEFPVPEHLPEPATALLLGLGSLIFVGRRTKR